MKILVTGGAGFIGSQVVDAYLKAGHQVAVIDNLSTGKRANLPERINLHEGNITDENFVKKVFQEFQPEVVNHHAAQISVVVSVASPLQDAELNILGTLTILEAVRHTPSVKKVIYSSSGGAMYGDPTGVPCTEETAAKPVSPYGLSKHTAERYIWLYTTFSPFKATVLRYANVYGPRQDPHGEAGVCAIFSARMLKGEPVTIFGDGSQIRDYIYVGDIVAANLLALDKGDGESYNISTGRGTTTKQVFETLKAATGYQPEAVMGAARPGELQEVVLSPEKALLELGWKAEVDFQTGTKLTVAWYNQ